MKKTHYLGLLLLLICSHAFAAMEIKFKVDGLKGDELKNAQARLQVVRKIYPKKISMREIRHIYKMSPKEVKLALQPYGYYQSHVYSRLSYKDNEWVAYFRVDKGKPLTITGLKINVIGVGRHNKAIEAALKDIQLKEGDVLVSDDYEDAKDKLYNTANNQGYIKAAFTADTQILINLKQYTAYVTISLDTGKRYFFGKTTFNESPYSKSFLKRFVQCTEGRPFSNQALLDLQQDMAGSTYFDSVDINPEFDKARNTHIPLQINTSVPRSQRYSVGIGYGTFTGPRLSAGLKLRRLTNTGHHFDANVRLSSVLSAITAKYFIPGANPINDRWVLGGDYKKFEPKNGSSESLSFLFGHIRKRGNLQTSITLNYLRERYNVKDEPYLNRNFLYPNLTLNYLKTDDIITPTNGYSLNLTLLGALDKFFSATNFFQIDAKGKFVITPLSFAKFIGRAEIGYSLVNELRNLPLTLRFFTGGPTSIRGFQDSSIGPGKYLQVGSLEYQNKLYGNIWGAAFYDIGTASNHVWRPVNRGAGLGLVYYSIVGPIKIYVARAISKKRRPYSIEFSIGPEF